MKTKKIKHTWSEGKTNGYGDLVHSDQCKQYIWAGSANERDCICPEPTKADLKLIEKENEGE